jgi:DNA polymerase I
MAARIVLIDGNALVHRAFHALPPLTSPKGELVNATYGVASMLLKVLPDLHPEYVAAAFDTPVPTFRHIEFDGYKAQRGPAPEGLSEQFARVHEFMDAMGIPTFHVDGFEADDVLGTLARQARELELHVVILTGDTDALQLVTSGVEVLTSRRGFSDTVLYGEQSVLERYGIPAGALADLRGLKGDASDNIPGVPGIGEKTASKLIAEYGSLDGIYENLERLSPKQRQLLSDYRDQAFRSRHLAEIVTDVPVKLELEKCRSGSYDRLRLVEFFRELGFKSLADRIPKEGAGGAPIGTLPEVGTEPAGQLSLFALEAEPGASPAAAIPGEGARSVTAAAESRSAVAISELDERAPAYHVVTDEANLERLEQRLRAAPIFSLDLETTGKDALKADMVGLSFSTMQGTAYYVPVGHLPPAARGLGLLTLDEPEHAEDDEPSQLPCQLVLERLRPVLEDPTVRKCAHNAQYDMLVLANYGIHLQGMAFDTMVAAYLLESTQRALGLKDLAWTRLKAEMQSYSDLAGKGKTATTLDRIPIRRVADYSCADADMTLRLKENLEPDLKAASLDELFERMEMPLVPVLVAMEQAGVKLDDTYLKELSTELYRRIRELETDICEAAGHSFNIGSTQQLGNVLYNELKLPATRRTKTGYSTDADVLEELRGTHPIVELILEHRQMVKLKSTYADALPLLVNRKTGRVHTSFNQTATSTGRLSSSDPNLQNIPIRTEMGRRVRKAFVVGDAESVLLSADYSQIELRVLAHMTGDPVLVDAFRHGEDIHAATAALVYGIPISEVTPRERRIAKTVNFGVLYGMSDYGLSRDTGLSRKEAALFIESYFQRYGSVKEFFERLKRQAELDGYVSTLWGRRRYVPELRTTHRGLRQAAERMAINMPIQGTAADIIKVAMINLHRYIEEKSLRSRMILQVHDELLFECPRVEVESLAPQVKRMMESAMPLQVPVVVDLKVGSNWDEMQPLAV